MTPADAGGGRGGVSPPVATAFAVVGFFALFIAGSGVLSLLTGAEVMPVTGLGQLPGIGGTALAVAGFAGATWLTVRAGRPRHVGALTIALTAFLGYLIGMLLGGVLGGADAARLAAAIGGFATSWFAVVLASAALIAGWVAVALVRTAADRPRWPWERDEE